MQPSDSAVHRPLPGAACGVSPVVEKGLQRQTNCASLLGGLESPLTTLLHPPPCDVEPLPQTVAEEDGRAGVWGQHWKAESA